VRVVLDVNVLVAGFTARGFCAEVVEAGLADHVLLIDDQLIADVTRVLARRFRASPTMLEEVRGHLALRGERVAALPLSLPVCRDPDDDAILALAKAGDADAVVTGDDDLLVLHPWDGLPILRPREFWSWADAGTQAADGRRSTETGEED
jgi:putative PIN family toxin of toxin-antitoxin system